MTDSGQPGSQGGRRPAANRDLMTTTGSFEAAWRDLGPRVERLLWSKGVKRDVVDDVTQETAIKLYANWDRVDPERPLWPLARTIAVNSLVDHFRTRTAEPVGEVPDEPAAYDLEEHGLARARLSNVASAMGTLRSKDRSMLLAEVDPDSAGRSTSAYKMARMRARQRLAKALDRSAAAFGGVPLGLRRIGVWLQNGAGGESYAAALTGAAVAVTIAAASVVPQAPLHPESLGGRKVRVVRAAKATAQEQEPGRIRKAVARRPARPAATATPAPPSRAAEQTPRPSPGPRHEQELADAGGRKAKTGSGRGYSYVVVCHEDDENPTSVTIIHDGNNEAEDQEYCEE